jgi:predicted ATPase
MIRSFEILDPANTHIEWLSKVPALAKPRKFEFTPGLNILWGENGSGKTTVIKALARYFHCEQSGNPIVTRNSTNELVPRTYDQERSDPKAFLKASVVEHDGQGVRYFDPSVAVGLLGGGFDDDFFFAGINNTLFRGSAGETTMYRFDKLAASVIRNEVPKIEYKLTEKCVNDLWADRIRIIRKLLTGSGAAGPPTVLLDEPERSFDFPRQLGMWRFIRAMSTRAQIIVASHSFFGLKLPEAHYIEMGEGYLDLSKRCLNKLTTSWTSDTPQPEEFEENFAKVQEEKIDKAKSKAKKPKSR